MLLQSDEARAEMLMKKPSSDVTKRWSLYQQMAAIQYKARINNQSTGFIRYLL